VLSVIGSERISGELFNPGSRNRQVAEE